MQTRRMTFRRRDVINRRGGASVSLVLAWPFYILISALVLEVIMLCMNYLTITSAMDRAVSQAKQWIPHRSALLVKGRSYEQQIHREVCKSLLPYAITRDRSNEESSDDNDIVRQLEESSFDPRMAVHYRRRWNRVSQATTVKIATANTRGVYQDVTVEVCYESPFWIPVIGRIMGSKSTTGANYYVWQIRQSNRFTVLADQWRRTSIGIEYDPFQSIKSNP
jgi:hypothetical protein